MAAEASPFLQAFERLLSRAPGPVFPRARALYLLKYSLEAATEPARFRTFLLEEEIQEASGGALRIRAVAFAVVHWQAPQIAAQAYTAYLIERWGIQPSEVRTIDDRGWFRDGGAWARFQAAAVYERAAPTTLLNP